MIADDARLSRSDEIMAVSSGEGLLMLSVDQGRYFSLNETAAVIWSRLEGGVSLADLCAGLASEYQTTAQGCRPAVVRTILALAAQGAVLIDGGGAAA